MQGRGAPLVQGMVPFGASMHVSLCGTRICNKWPFNRLASSATLYRHPRVILPPWVGSQPFPQAALMPPPCAANARSYVGTFPMV